jgi:hypothetical protein
VSTSDDIPEDPLARYQDPAWPPAAEPGAVAVADPAGPPSPVYPIQLEISYPAELNRWLPLVKWLLVIPHFIVLWFLGIGAAFVALFGWFAVLFTGRWPRGAFEYLVGVWRWSYRVIAYALLMTDAYPPFTLADVPGHPIRLDIEYPEHIANWRPLVHWLLVIPYFIVAGFLYWLTGVLSIAAFFTVLFTKRIPRGLFEMMVPGLRWNLRASAYSYFMTERYPPFLWG